MKLKLTHSSKFMPIYNYKILSKPVNRNCINSVPLIFNTNNDTPRQLPPQSVPEYPAYAPRHTDSTD